MDELLGVEFLTNYGFLPIFPHQIRTLMKVSSVTIRDSILSLGKMSLDFVFVSFTPPPKKRKE